MASCRSAGSVRPRCRLLWVRLDRRDPRAYPAWTAPMERRGLPAPPGLRVKPAIPDPRGQTGPAGSDGVTGPTGPEGPEGPPGIGIGVSDGAGADLGLLVEWGSPSGDGPTISYLPAIDALVSTSRTTLPHIYSGSDVWFQFPGCQGDAFIDRRAAGFLTPAGAPDRFFVGRPAVAASTSYYSYLTDANCIEATGSRDLIPAEEITEPLGFTSQLVAPIWFHQLMNP